VSPKATDAARHQRRRESVGTNGYRCRKCGQPAARHRVNGEWLCCKCYVRAGYQPAEWHPECMEGYAIRKT
jgi:hypothetical protein